MNHGIAEKGGLLELRYPQRHQSPHKTTSSRPCSSQALLVDVYTSRTRESLAMLMAGSYMLCISDMCSRTHESPASSTGTQRRRGGAPTHRFLSLILGTLGLGKHWEVSACSSTAGRMQTGPASESTSRRRPSSALAISTSSTRTLITSTPAGSTPAAHRQHKGRPRDDPGCPAADLL